MGKTKNRNVAVVIPAYNEERDISQVIRSIPSTITIDNTLYKFVNVVVDDCSSDKTADNVRNENATIVSHVINSGAGAATRTGLYFASRSIEKLSYAITIDADGQHSAKDIEKLLRYAVKNNSSMIVGSRLHPDNNTSMPRHRRYGNVGLSLISRLLFGIKTKDTQSGLRLLRFDVIPKVGAYTIDRYGFCTEMLWLAKRHDIEVVEVPISVRYSDETLNKGQNNWGVVSLLIDLLWIRISR